MSRGSPSLLRARALLGLLLVVGCSDPQIRAVVPEIQVTATHQTADGALLLDYGPVPVLNLHTLDLLVDNLGQVALTLTSVTLEDEAGVFSLDEGLDGSSVPTAGTAKLSVHFRPQEQRAYSGKLILTHDDPARGPVEVLLSGTGSTVGRIEVTPAALDFGRVGELEQAVLGLTIRSVGTAALIVEAIELVEGSAPEFSFAGSARTPATLPAPVDGQPGAEVVLPIRCAPTDATALTQLGGTIRIRSTDPERQLIEIPLVASVNRAPLAEIAPLAAGVAAPLDTVQLDGTLSTDPDGDLPLTYAWRVFRRPIGSTAEFVDAQLPIAQLTFDEPGDYELGLDVADAAGLSCLHAQGDSRIPCARTTVRVKPADDLYYELVWNNSETDLDLHLVDAGYALYSDRDCYYGNPAPNFGDFLRPDDDPRLLRDDLNGYGPETIVHSKPPSGKTNISVIYFSDHGSATAEEPAISRATVRVYVYGVLAAEVTRELSWEVGRTAALEWDVLTVDWPTATIETIDVLQDAPTP